MLQLTLRLNGTARVEVAGCQVLEHLTSGIFLPLLLKGFSQSFLLSFAQERYEGTKGCLLWDKGALVLLATHKIIIIFYKVSE